MYDLRVHWLSKRDGRLGYQWELKYQFRSTSGGLNYLINYHCITAKLPRFTFKQVWPSYRKITWNAITEITKKFMSVSLSHILKNIKTTLNLKKKSHKNATALMCTQKYKTTLNSWYLAPKAIFFSLALFVRRMVNSMRRHFLSQKGIACRSISI